MKGAIISFGFGDASALTRVASCLGQRWAGVYQQSSVVCLLSSCRLLGLFKKSSLGYQFPAILYQVSHYGFVQVVGHQYRLFNIPTSNKGPNILGLPSDEAIGRRKLITGHGECRLTD